jgi:tetratricopeptide (TPR) repeat protein
MVDLLRRPTAGDALPVGGGRGRASGGEPPARGTAAPGVRDDRAGGADHGRTSGRLADRLGSGALRGNPALARLLLLPLLAVLAAGPGCASGAGSDGPAAGEDDRSEPAAGTEDDAAGESRRAASGRLLEEGRTALEEGRLEEAASRIERAVRLDPSNGRAYVALAEVRIAQGRPDEAAGLLERALTLLEADTPAAARADSLRNELGDGPD